MQKFTENEIAQAYAYYGVHLSGVEPVQNARIEKIILAVIESPPPGRFISTLAALIGKNEERVDFDYLTKQVSVSQNASAKLGYILELTKNCAEKLGHPNRQEMERKLDRQLCKLHPSPQVVIWIAEDSKKFYEPDFEPKEEHEIKWNVVTRYQVERFEDHWKSYVRYA